MKEHVVIPVAYEVTIDEVNDYYRLRETKHNTKMFGGGGISEVPECRLEDSFCADSVVASLL